MDRKMGWVTFGEKFGENRASSVVNHYYTAEIKTPWVTVLSQCESGFNYFE